MNHRIQLIKYLIADIVAAATAWALFYSYRKVEIESLMLRNDFSIHYGTSFYIGIAVIPLLWVLLYYASGYYREVFRKSRLAELWYTMRISFLGILVIFFGLILDDVISNYSDYYRSFSVLFLLHFSLTYIPRLIITTNTTHKIHKGLIGFNTLIIGGSEKAMDIYREIKDQPLNLGNIIIGFLNVNQQASFPLSKELDHLGDLSTVGDVIDKYDVHEVIIALEYSEHDRVEKILNLLIDKNVVIKTIPSLYDIFTGTVKMSTILGTPLIEVSHHLMPAWQDNMKYFIDVIFSLLALIILSPLCIILALGVKISTRGPVFYKQDRVGKNGKPFSIYKFRSMYMNAEENGPELSSKNDKRITRLGRFMRKHRLDEIPNFINVLKGDMSLVGPRPERQHFIDKITEKAPHYTQLLKVRPGITSWGQVKYGYAENVEEMVRRMKYDLIYLENMSLYVDFKIMIYTLMTIIKGTGK